MCGCLVLRGSSVHLDPSSIEAALVSIMVRDFFSIIFLFLLRDTRRDQLASPAFAQN